MAKAEITKSKAILKLHQLVYRGTGDRGVAVYELEFVDGSTRMIRQPFIKDLKNQKARMVEGKLYWSWNGDSEYPTVLPKMNVDISASGKSGTTVPVHIKRGKVIVPEDNKYLVVSEAKGVAGIFGL